VKVVHFIDMLADSRFSSEMIVPIRRLGNIGLLTALLAGCGDSPMEVVEVPAPIDLSGVWDLTEVLLRSTQPVVCSDTGSFRLSNNHNQIAGAGEKVGTCRGLIAEFTDERTFSVRDGVVRDSIVEFFVTGGCGVWGGTPIDARYTGTISRGPPLRMSGSSACSVNFNGSWEATPAVPTASISLSPSSAEMVLHETIYLQPVLYSASGARLFERSLTWQSSDTTVATVGENGSVFGTGVGSVTIQVAESELTAVGTVVTSAVSFTALYAGAYHTCGITTDGEAYCWGANDVGQSGPSPSLAPCPGVLCRHAPGAVPGPAQFGMLTGGFYNTCGIGLNGSAYCWGGNSTGQLGAGVLMPGTPTPLAVTGGHTYSSLAAGTSHVCGVTEIGAVYCWGANNRGQIGPSAPDPGLVPYGVSSELSFSSVVAGGLHSCGLAVDGSTFCWGWNWNGQLGNDSVIASSEPTEVSDAPIFASITTGASYNCGLTPDGSAYCWGDGDEGQLGVDSVDFSATPRPVSGSLQFSTISAGAFHVCGVVADGSAYCWGEGDYGRLGSGTTETAYSPVAVLGGLHFSSITAGGEHTCATSLDGLAYCWGANYSGQLGQFSTTFSAIPVKVIGQR
jgi:alpha-tubulin suppressor-like RCC1 family protein